MSVREFGHEIVECVREFGREIVFAMAVFVVLALLAALLFLPMGFGLRGYLIMAATLTLVGWFSIGMQLLVASFVGGRT